MIRKHRCGRGVLKFRDQFLKDSAPGIPDPVNFTSKANGMKPLPGSNNVLTVKPKITNSTQNHRAEESRNNVMAVDGTKDDMIYRDMRNFPTISISNNRVENKRGLKKLLAKFTYKANPERPGGFEELSMKQGDKIYFLEKHEYNPHWIKVENKDGKTGYVPASYTMALESSSGLPWLEHKKDEERKEKQEKEQQIQNTGFGAPSTKAPSAFKPYVSAYSQQSQTSSEAASQYECKLCGKNFNGPLPYKMHLASKAHKEEEAMQGY